MTTQVARLRRELGLLGAIMMGLGSMIGTGVFVSVGLGAGVAGPSVILAVAMAALLALCNGMSSAQLAAHHPVSGGTYEYGYKYLNPWLGFVAGWMFLVAKSASAASAALGFAGYTLSAVGAPLHWLVPLSLAVALAVTLVVLTGIRRSNTTNTIIVSITLAALGFFVLAGLPPLLTQGTAHLSPFFAPQAGSSPLSALFHASALMFVAYTGYGRIATLGEEVREPTRTIPRAIILTMVVTMALYIAVTAVAVGTLGAQALESATRAQAAPLVAAAQRFGIPFSPAILTLGAITAMLGVLLNLILGLSRVLLAMGRRGDMPVALGRLNRAGTTPPWAVLVVGAIVVALVLVGDVKTTWSFSAFTVLIYYAITNLSALRLPREERIAPAWVSALGLVGCLFLAFWVEQRTWLIGLGLIGLGLAWHAAARAIRSTKGAGQVPVEDL